MSFSVIVTLTSASIDAGPVFDLYSDLDGFTTPFENDVPKASLLAGYTTVNVPNGTTQIKVVSDGVVCTNNVIVQLPTTTTTIACKCHEIIIEGTSTISWVGYDLNVQTFTYTDVTINACARLGSITSSGGTVTITASTTDCVAEADCWPALTLKASGINKMAIRLVAIYGSPFTTSTTIPWRIVWGDGTHSDYNGSKTFNAGDAHIYSSFYTGDILLKAPSLELFRKIIDDILPGYISYSTGNVELDGAELAKLVNLQGIQATRWIVNAATTQLPSLYFTWYYTLNGTTTGDVADLPNTLLSMTIYGTNTLTGDLSDVPSGLVTEFRVRGNNTITGNISNLPVNWATSLKDFEIHGQNDIDGDVSVFSGYAALFSMYVIGFNTLHGDIGTLPVAIKYIRLLGYSYPSGDTVDLTAMTQLITLQLENNNDDPYLPALAGNTLTGDIANLPDSLITTIVSGKNTLSGDLVDMPIGGSLNCYWMVKGYNTLTGDLASITSKYVAFFVGGNNTIYGDIADINPSLYRFIVEIVSGGTGDNSGIVGDLSDLPMTDPVNHNLKQFSIHTNHHVKNYSTSITFVTDINLFQVIPFDRTTYAMPTAELDQLIIDLANASWIKTTSFNNELELVGTRTAASNLAVSTLLTIPAPNTVAVNIAP